MAQKKAIDSVLAQAFGEIEDGKYTGKLKIPEGPCPTLGGLLTMAKERFGCMKTNGFNAVMRPEVEESSPRFGKPTLLQLVKDLRRQAKIFR